MNVVPFKPCEFLKSYSEVYISSQFLAHNRLYGNPCDCKNWDMSHVLAQLTHGNLLDMGCQGSLILPNAVCMGLYGEKVGIDLEMTRPIAGATILQGDITDTRLPSNNFDFITCMSVIEHGVNLDTLSKECFRLLKVGGTFFVSFDYWPEKIEHNIRCFNAPWKIFTREDVVEMLNIFRAVGMEPVADVDWTIKDGVLRPGYWSPGPTYTFGILQFEKMQPHSRNKAPSPSAIAVSPAIAPANNVLYVNNKVEACGVHQMGRRVFETLVAHQERYRFHLVECENADEVLAAARTCGAAAVIFNSHPWTLPFAGPELIADLDVPCLGFFHDITSEILQRPWPPFPFKHWIHSDPSAPDNCPFMFPTVRPTFEYENRFPLPKVPTIGTFGFGLPQKGFPRLASLVQSQFGEAVLRMHMPVSAYVDPEGYKAMGLADAVRRAITNPRIRLEITHHMMSTNDLLDFLAQNSINAFLYDTLNESGISSTIDYAISVDRPIAITRSGMFRHIRDAKPTILVEEATLREIIDRGIEPLRRYKQAWSHEKMVAQYEDAVESVIAEHAAAQRD